MQGNCRGGSGCFSETHKRKREKEIRGETDRGKNKVRGKNKLKEEIESFQRGKKTVNKNHRESCKNS